VKKGEYTDSACTKKAAKKGKGKFEKTTGRSYTSSGGKAELSTPAFGPGKVICTANTDAGEITGPTTDVDRVMFTSCEFEGLECESAGPNSTPSGKKGVIITNLLDSRLVDNPEGITFLNAETSEVETKGPAAGEVWEELVSSEHEPYSSEFNCGGVVFLRTQGQDTGVFTSGVNVLSSVDKTAFEAGKGADGLLTEVLTESGWAGPAPSIEEAGEATVTNASKIEVKALPAEFKLGPAEIQKSLMVVGAEQEVEFSIENKTGENVTIKEVKLGARTAPMELEKKNSVKAPECKAAAALANNASCWARVKNKAATAGGTQPYLLIAKNLKEWTAEVEAF